MRTRYYIAAIYLCAITNAQGQINVYLPLLKDSSLNILQTGIVNTLRIENLPDGAKVKFNNKYLEPQRVSTNCKDFNLEVTESHKYWLEVTAREKLLYSREYVYMRLGDIKVLIGARNDNTLTVPEIMEHPSIVCAIENCYLKNCIKLVGYQLTIVKNKKEVKSWRKGKNKDGINTPVLGSDLPDLNDSTFDIDLQNEIRQLKKDDKIYIEDIVVVGPDNYWRLISPKFVTIK